MNNKTRFTAVLAAFILIMSFSGCKSKPKGEVIDCFDRFSFTVPFSDEEMQKKGYPEHFYEEGDEGTYGWALYNDDNELEKGFQIEWYLLDYHSVEEINEAYTEDKEEFSKSAIEGVAIYEVESDYSDNKIAIIYLLDPVAFKMYALYLETNDESLYSRDMIRKIFNSFEIRYSPTEVDFFGELKFDLPFTEPDLEKKGYYMGYPDIDEDYQQGEYYWQSDENVMMLEYWTADPSDADYYLDIMEDSGLGSVEYKVAGLTGFYGYGVNTGYTEYVVYTGIAFLTDNEKGTSYCFVIQSDDGKLFTENAFKKMIDSIRK